MECRASQHQLADELCGGNHHKQLSSRKTRLDRLNLFSKFGGALFMFPTQHSPGYARRLQSPEPQFQMVRKSRFKGGSLS